MPENPVTNGQKVSKNTSVAITRDVKSQLDNLRLALIGDAMLDTSLGQLIESMVKVCEKHRGELAEARKDIQ